MATASGSAGTASMPSRGSIARCGRPGRTRTCAICAGTSARICSSPMCAPPPARRHAAELPSLRLRPLDVHAQRPGRRLEAGAPPGRGADPGRRSTARASAPPIPRRCSSPSWAPASRATRSPRPRASWPRLTELVEIVHDEPLRFTAALSNGHDLYAFRYLRQRHAELALLRCLRRRGRDRLRAARRNAGALEGGSARTHGGRPGRTPGRDRAVSLGAAGRGGVAAFPSPWKRRTTA